MMPRKHGWLVKVIYYEENPSAIDGAGRRADDVTERKGLVAASSELKLFGKIVCDFLSCDKHLLSGVTIRLSLRRSPNDFVVISEDAAKHYKVQIIEANLYVRKMTVTDYVLSSIEKTLLKNPAIYNYLDVVPKTFLTSAGVQSWRQEDVFAKEPVRRMIVAMSINEAYLGTNRTNPFQYQKFGLNEIIVYRNGLPIAGTPISTSDNKRTYYYNTLEALDFVLVESVSLIMIIIILWLLISRLLRRLHTILFILNGPIALFRSNSSLTQVSVITSSYCLWESVHQQFMCVQIEKLPKTLL